MLQANEAKNNQIILLMTLGVFLIGIALNYYAPSPAALRQDIARLK